MSYTDSDYTRSVADISLSGATSLLFIGTLIAAIFITWWNMRHETALGKKLSYITCYSTIAMLLLGILLLGNRIIGATMYLSDTFIDNNNQSRNIRLIQLLEGLFNTVVIHSYLMALTVYHTVGLLDQVKLNFHIVLCEAFQVLLIIVCSILIFASSVAKLVIDIIWYKRYDVNNVRLGKDIVGIVYDSCSIAVVVILLLVAFIFASLYTKRNGVTKNILLLWEMITIFFLYSVVRIGCSFYMYAISTNGSSAEYVRTISIWTFTFTLVALGVLLLNYCLIMSPSVNDLTPKVKRQRMKLKQVKKKRSNSAQFRLPTMK